VIFIPNADTWHATLEGPALTAFLNMLRAIPPTDPVLVLATAECEIKNLPAELTRDLFGFSRRNHMEISRPDKVS
jgi:ATPase family AAA domain-containing protein 2